MLSFGFERSRSPHSQTQIIPWTTGMVTSCPSVTPRQEANQHWYPREISMVLRKSVHPWPSLSMPFYEPVKAASDFSFSESAPPINGTSTSGEIFVRGVYNPPKAKLKHYQYRLRILVVWNSNRRTSTAEKKPKTARYRLAKRFLSNTDGSHLKNYPVPNVTETITHLFWLAGSFL